MGVLTEKSHFLLKIFGSTKKILYFCQLNTPFYEHIKITTQDMKTRTHLRVIAQHLSIYLSYA